MQFTKLFAITALLAFTAVAAPAADADATRKTKPARPPPPPPPQNNNSCGNGATPYCCNTDNYGKYTSCFVLGGGSQCSATTVCCNAQNSIQVCLGNVSIL